MTFSHPRYNHRQDMSYVTLNKVEMAVLKNSARRGDADTGFQKLLVSIDRLLDEKTGQIYISEQTHDLIKLYGGGKLSWHGTLHAIFGRTMGEALSRKR